MTVLFDEVGIGTATPGSPLQVNGGAAIGYNAPTSTPANGLSVNGHLVLEGITSTGSTGSGDLVFGTSPALVTPSLGDAVANSFNGNTITTGFGTLSLTAGKTLTDTSNVGPVALKGTTDGGFAPAYTTDLIDVHSGIWTPTDQSGAGLTFTGVNCRYQNIGNMVFAYGELVYPTTADGLQAIISLPLGVANQLYARGLSASVVGGPPGLLIVPGMGTGNATFVVGTTVQINANFSASRLHFIVIYPAS